MAVVTLSSQGQLVWLGVDCAKCGRSSVIGGNSPQLSHCEYFQQHSPVCEQHTTLQDGSRGETREATQA
jgi:hypothetical protein